MFDLIPKLFGPAPKMHANKDRIADLLRVDRTILEQFEKAYDKAVLRDEAGMVRNAKQASAAVKNRDFAMPAKEAAIEDLIERIVEELLEGTVVLEVKDGQCRLIHPEYRSVTPVTNAEIMSLPESLRPQLTGSLLKKDVNGDGFEDIMMLLIKSREAKSAKERTQMKMHFLQGVSILDLDPVIYQILGMNRNSMSHWLPAIATAAWKHGFFKIPETRIALVPMPLLQLSRLEYMEMTTTTMKIVDLWAMRAFGLSTEKDYFIKTGVFSSKFDFRNAKVTAGKEVTELGEYLLFIQYQTTEMGGGVHWDGKGLYSAPVVIGPALTNEWVVREFIHDKEGNTTIYHGLPLHTEYRVFVDFDTDEILGISPYWRPDVMKERFSGRKDAETPDMVHDYVTYTAQEPDLMRRYEENKDTVMTGIQALLADVDLTGQWSVDIMQNGNDFWIIDMALASQSALSDCVPAGKLKQTPITEENWIPDMSKEELKCT